MSAISEYFRGAIHELRNVTWPTQKQAIRLSVITIGFVLVGALFFGLFDALLNQLFFSLAA